MRRFSFIRFDPRERIKINLAILHEAGAGGPVQRKKLSVETQVPICVPEFKYTSTLLHRRTAFGGAANRYLKKLVRPL